MARPMEMVILDVETGEYILLHGFEPPSKGRTVNYDDVAVRGRSEPYQFYSSTETGVWSFKVRLVASVEQNDRGDPVTVLGRSDFIESLAMPDYGDDPGQVSSVVQPPHLTRLAVTGTEGVSIDITGTLRGFQSQWQLPYDIVTGLPTIIDVSFEIHEQTPYGQRPKGYADVRKRLLKGQTRLA